MKNSCRKIVSWRRKSSEECPLCPLRAGNMFDYNCYDRPEKLKFFMLQYVSRVVDVVSLAMLRRLVPHNAPRLAEFVLGSEDHV